MNENLLMVGSHQPHYFPWLGYLDKMAKVDLFLINDVAQLETKSPMTRNKIMDRFGREKYLSVTIEKECDIYSSQNKNIFLKNWSDVSKHHLNLIEDSYRKSRFFSEVYPLVRNVLDRDFLKLIDLQMATIVFLREVFQIKTRIKFHSELTYQQGSTTSERIVNKLLAVGANIYLSGNGAKKYMDDSIFLKNGIMVRYQNFKYPEYHQINSASFVPNLSSLDILFNCGVEGARNIFNTNLQVESRL